MLDGQWGDYCRSVALADGAPVLIPLELSEHAWRRIYERLDGLLFPGGVDVSPSFYGEEPHPQLGQVDDALDEAELALVRWALADRMPVLGICRGIQLLNVAAGGSLYQDLSAQLPGSLLHACPDTPRAHAIHITPGTRLAAALCSPSVAGEHRTSLVQTNSRHHQAVKDVAPGFVATAHAPDGIIEGIEMIDAPFVIGVQWHPENLAPTDPQMLDLFRAFVKAAASK
jgi:putative glutamine amidotransferase